jgi:RimJ/RimL family protein N-acetyltransferase
MLLKDNDVHNEFYIESLTNWRKRYMKYFLTQFETSINRTRAWLTNTVIPSSNRLLFLIFDENKRLIGNIGLANIEDNKCELDNLIRGERGGHPRLIYYSEIALLKWIFFEKSLNFVNLHVFSNNLPTLKLHTSVGFKEIDRKKLCRFINEKGGISYIGERGSSATELAPFEYVEMGMSSKFFHSIHSLN